MAEDGPQHQDQRPLLQLLPCSLPGEPLPHRPTPICESRSRSGGLVAQSAVAPPGPIPNPVVTHRSAGEYCGVAPREARPLRAPQIGSIRELQESEANKEDGANGAVLFSFMLTTLKVILFGIRTI